MEKLMEDWRNYEELRQQEWQIKNDIRLTLDVIFDSLLQNLDKPVGYFLGNGLVKVNFPLDRRQRETLQNNL
jgi:hypothetical protein